MNICSKFTVYLCCAFSISLMQNTSKAASSVEEYEDYQEPNDISTSSIDHNIDNPPQEDLSTLSWQSAAPNFRNPVYPEYSNIEEIYIPNASVANFSSNGLIGATIRSFQNCNNIPNPNGCTHSGFLFQANPWDLTQRIIASMNTKGSELYKYQQSGAEMIYDIARFYPEVRGTNSSSLQTIAVFCAESDGSAGEVLKGVYPHVHVHPFEQNVEVYNGAVSFRPCMRKIDINQTLDIVLKYLGTPYESPLTLGSMINAVKNKNKVEQSDKLFCSEFVALAYKDLGLLAPDINVSNVIPEELSCAAEKYDLLKDVCGEDILLKTKRQLHKGIFCGCC